VDIVIEDGLPVAIPANSNSVSEELFNIFSGPPAPLADDIESEDESSNEDVCLIS
jgi:hypothetical protein